MRTNQLCRKLDLFQSPDTAVAQTLNLAHYCAVERLTHDNHHLHSNQALLLVCRQFYHELSALVISTVGFIITEPKHLDHFRTLFAWQRLAIHRLRIINNAWVCPWRNPPASEVTLPGLREVHVDVAMKRPHWMARPPEKRDPSSTAHFEGLASFAKLPIRECMVRVIGGSIRDGKHVVALSPVASRAEGKEWAETTRRLVLGRRD